MEMMDIVMGIIGIVVAVLVIALVLIPTVQSLNLENSTYTTLIGVTVTIVVILPIIMAVRIMAGKN